MGHAAHIMHSINLELQSASEIHSEMNFNIWGPEALKNTKYIGPMALAKGP